MATTSSRAHYIALSMHMAHLSLHQAAFAVADNRSHDINIRKLIAGLENLVVVLKAEYEPAPSATEEAVTA